MEVTRYGNRLVITIRPDPSDAALLRISEAFQQVLDTLKLFEKAQRWLGNPHADFVWRLEKASTASPFTIVARAEPVGRAVDVTPQVLRCKELIATGTRNLIARAEPSPWMDPESISILKGLFFRNLNGIAETDIDFDVSPIERLSIDRIQAGEGMQAVEAITAIDTSEIPERIAYGEIEGQMLAAGRYSRRPAIQIRTHLYGFVWCVLSRALVSRFGNEHKLAEIWEGKTIGVSGRLYYLNGGRLNRIDTEGFREIVAPPFDLDAILDPDFTAGYDPVEYLDKLHEGDLD